MLHINSPGGNLYAGIAASKIIQDSIIPIIIVTDGLSASAATFLSVMSENRIMMPYSFMVIHQISIEGYFLYF